MSVTPKREVARLRAYLRLIARLNDADELIDIARELAALALTTRTAPTRALDTAAKNCGWAGWNA